MPALVLRHAMIVFVASLALACGNRAEPSTPPGSSGSAAGTGRTPEATSGASSTGTPAPSAEPGDPPRPRKPFEIYNACGDVVLVAFGDDPKGGSAGQRTIAPSASIEAPRDADGNQTVWLIDKGEPLLKVNVTRGMKRVEVGRSCRTLDAR